VLKNKKNKKKTILQIYFLNLSMVTCTSSPKMWWLKLPTTTSFKMPFQHQDSSEINWFKDDTELFDGGRIKVVKELNQSRLQIKEFSGEIKIHLKNPFGTAEAFAYCGRYVSTQLYFILKIF